MVATESEDQSHTGALPEGVAEEGSRAGQTDSPIGTDSLSEDPADIDHQLDWESPARPGWSEAHRILMRRRNNKLMAIALSVSVAVHAIAIGSLYAVFRKSSPPDFSFARSDGSAAGNNLDLDRIETGRVDTSLAHQNAFTLPASAGGSEARVPDPGDEESPGVWTSSRSRPDASTASQMLGTEPPDSDDSSQSVTPRPMLLPKPIARQLPAVASTRPTVIASAKPLSAVVKTNNARAGNMSLDSAPPKLASSDGSRGGDHKARNGYDNRGLPIPDYPAESRLRRQQGLVVLDVEVSIDGRAGRIIVNKSPGFADLTNAAIEAIREAQFVPAEKGGRPVVGYLRIPFRFVLEQ